MNPLKSQRNTASMFAAYRAATLSIAAVLMVPGARPAIARPFQPPGLQLVLTTINAERLAKHLAPLQLDRRLCRVAYDHALDMLRRGYFDHATPEGLNPDDRMRDADLRFDYAGENLGEGSDLPTILDEFWRSSEHRSNVLDRHYERVGLAAVDGPDGTIVVEDFGGS